MTPPTDPIDLKSIVGWLFGVVMALVLFIWKRQTGDLEKQNAETVRRLEKIEAEAARKHEIEELREDIDGKHGDNVGRLNRIEDKIDIGITGTHKRIDTLFEKLAEKDQNSRGAWSGR